MALRRILSKRLLNYAKPETTIPSRIGIVEHSPIFSSHKPPNVSPSLNQEFISSPNSSSTGFFRRFLQQRREIFQSAANELPKFLSLPVGDKLREKLKLINSERLHFDGLVPPSPSRVPESGGTSVVDVRKVLRCAQLEKLRFRLREIPTNSISYYEFMNICSDECENREQGLEFAKMLDESGSVIILSNVVFLRPDQVAKSVEKLMIETIGMPNDPRRKQLEGLERQKAMIDQKAESQVRTELYCGLGFLILQTLGFMRLTFWELSWDVMEPICFFVTSLHFALAYGFFLRTAKEPSFEGYFRRRFKVKQKKLIKIHNFDVEKYNELCRAFYPTSANYCSNLGSFKVPL